MSVGTELLLGEIVDTNAAFLANELKARGVTLYHKSVVGDNLGRVVETLQLGLSRADLVIVGGGLGPTDDDLTREAIAQVVGETPRVDDELLRWLRQLFESRGRSFPDANRKQAWLIPSAEALANPIGTAPGWFVRCGHRIIVALPGPPREMQKMWREQVLPRLELPKRALWHTTLHTWGIGESHVAELLGELTQAANPSVATYARRHGVDVRVASSGETSGIAEQLAAPVLQEVQGALAAYLYGRDEQTLAGAVLTELAARGEKVASLDVRGAWLAELLAAGPAEAYAGGRIVTGARQLPDGVDSPDSPLEAGTLELARQVSDELNAGWGVSVWPGEGRCCLAISGPGVERTSTLDWPTDRRTSAERAAHGALMLLLRELRGQAGSPAEADPAPANNPRDDAQGDGGKP